MKDLGDIENSQAEIERKLDVRRCVFACVYLKCACVYVCVCTMDVEDVAIYRCMCAFVKACVVRVRVCLHRYIRALL